MVGSRRSEEVADSKMVVKQSSRSLKRALLVALRCVDPDASKQPKMGHVVHMLETADDRPSSQDDDEIQKQGSFLALLQDAPTQLDHTMYKEASTLDYCDDTLLRKSTKGVLFVAGDMFKSIPKGDAIFMKRILHDWSDEDCIKILKNCHNVLPTHGKVIIMDAVIVEHSTSEGNAFNKLRTSLDISMLAGTKGGKERTKDQWEIILKAASFVHFNFLELPCPRCIIEAFPTQPQTPLLS